MHGPIWCSLILLSLVPALFAWPVYQLRANVWVTLANATGQDTLCLATASPDNPFSISLVSLPLDDWLKPKTV